MSRDVAIFHLPGLFESYEFYKAFLPLYKEHREYFYDYVEIGSIYGAPQDCLWGGGRVEGDGPRAEAVLELLKKYGISARLTFSNSLLQKEHLSDRKCNLLCSLLAGDGNNGIILSSDLLLEYLMAEYSGLYYVSSTTKVLTDFGDLVRELDRPQFRYVVPDFRLNHAFDKLEQLSQDKKDKIEFLCNECCDYSCPDRRKCYEDVSCKNLGITGPVHQCHSRLAKEGYRFSRAMENPGFISKEEIETTYLPLGFRNFKIEGRGLGTAVLLEFLLYYLIKPSCHIHVREKLYLDSMLDLF